MAILLEVYEKRRDIYISFFLNVSFKVIIKLLPMNIF